MEDKKIERKIKEEKKKIQRNRKEKEQEKERIVKSPV